MKTHKRKAFTLIELLTTIAILILLIALTVGIIKIINTKAKIIRTRNTIVNITQALTIYHDNLGFFPDITTINDQYKLFEALTDDHIEITDFNNKVIKIINQPAIDFDSIQSANIIQQDSSNPNHYYFIDAWGTPLVYMYGKIENNSGYSYNDKRISDTETNTYYNVNWPDGFDLSSYGKDIASTNGNNQDRKDDIKNFT